MAFENTRARAKQLSNEVDSAVSENLEIVAGAGIVFVSALMVAGIAKAIKWAGNGDPDAVMYRVHNENGFSKLMSGKEYVRFMVDNGYTSEDKLHWTKVKD